MPQIGDIVRGLSIGKNASRASREFFIWVICPICQQGRWRRKSEGRRSRHSNSRPNLCHHCAVCRWRGGQIFDKKGYVLIKLRPDDFFSPMCTKQGYVYEHRLVVAKALNRCLLPWELVHHRGTKYPAGSKENKSDNRYPKNLLLITDKKYHLVDTMAKAYIKQLEKRIDILQKKLMERG